MRLAQSFSPLEPAEIDNFAIDFSNDIGSATISTVAWVCALAPNQDASLDPDPQSHILSTSKATTIDVRDPVTGLLNTLTGNYAIASVGGLIDSNVGALYILAATVTLSDGRVLINSATMLCAPEL